MKTPTRRQAEIYKLLYDFTREHGYQPSLRELGLRVGIRSVNAIVGHMRALAECGYVTQEFGQQRAVRFVLRPDGRPFHGFTDREVNGDVTGQGGGFDVEATEAHR